MKRGRQPFIQLHSREPSKKSSTSLSTRIKRPNAEGFPTRRFGKPWNMIIFRSRLVVGIYFLIFERFHRSQFLWWILDIYKKNKKLRVHENVANFSPTTSAELIFLCFAERTDKSFTLQGLAWTYGNAVAQLSVRSWINATHKMCRLFVRILLASLLRRYYIFINRIYAHNFLALAFTLPFVSICFFFAFSHKKCLRMSCKCKMGSSCKM